MARDESLARIDSLLARAAASTATTLILVGESGIGKSHSCRYAADRAASRGFTTIITSGVQWESGFELAAMAQVLDPLKPWFSRLPARDRSPLTGALGGGGSTDIDILRLAAATLACLVAAAESRPVLLVLDDAQWIDSTSVGVLTFVVRRLVADAVAVLIAQRSDAPKPFPQDWPRHVLPPLDTAEVWALISSLRPDLPTPAANVARNVERDVGGNPLAVLELAPQLQANVVAGMHPLPDPLPLGERGRRAFGDKISRLAPDSRMALAVLAATGTQTALIAAALAAQHLSIADLDAAVEAGIVSDRPVYGFTHPLYRSAAYLAASRAARRGIAASLAQLNRHVDLERFAFHAEIAGEQTEVVADALEDAARAIATRAGAAAAAQTWARAAELTTVAAQRRNRALGAAKSLFEAGDTRGCRHFLNEIIDSGPPDEGVISDGQSVWAEAVVLLCQAAIWHVTDQEPLELLFDHAVDLQTIDPRRALTAFGLLAGAFEGAGRLREAAALTSRAVQCADALTAADRLIALCWHAHTMTLSTGAASAPRVERLMSTVDLPALVESAPSAMWTLAQTALWQEDFVFGARVCRIAVAALRRSSNLAWLPYALGVQAQSLWWTGEWTYAAAVIAEAVEFAQQVGQKGLLGFLHATSALIAASTGRDVDCQEHARRAEQVAFATGLQPILLYSEHAPGLSALGASRFADAIKHFDQAHAYADRLGIGQPSVVPYLADFAEALFRIGDPERAATICQELAEAARLTGSGWAAAATARCKAMLNPQTDGSLNALAEYAAPRPAEVDLPFERYRLLLELGAQLRRRRRLPEARHNLAAASAGFTALGARAWLRRADAERRAAGDRRPAPASAPGSDLRGLSPQQLQVVMAVAAGATNREAAAALFISPKTVDYHLGRAFTILGVRSRVELAHLVATTQSTGTVQG